ncbi:NAD(P)/FAD-dependent oxidoreductase [Mycolicibacterium septicum DSM 44393]|uniref:NAD(P)/FAD-dependent oxidoreductase n=1 Tax=Mycolicibacterium septicum DSM 44393 TaxID=1341646 RepID=A0A7X6MPV0_9MYCO|nr:NAD(P)/FAD-dependent oxidoreductase [Mycolicibacterium septicum]NKZ10842.1 NAD(P)/FAD-dependent oxidoreductase [Mycolicibacterium septicum DSM 44393]
MVDHEIVIVGAGFSGIGVGIQLKKAGFHDFVILDAADGIGGVWHHNRYPGVAVDIPSTTYSYSFESNPTWSQLFAPGAELQAYAEHCATKYGVRDHIRLRTRVDHAVFDDSLGVWQVRTADSVITARFLIAAVGPLDAVKNPDIKGIDDFAGEIVHTARWDDAVGIEGRRVAVIGTGASGLQVIPNIADHAAHLDVYQRTAIWVVPKPNLTVPTWLQRLFVRIPSTQRAVRVLTTAFAEFVMTAGVVYHTRAPFLVRFIENVCRRHLAKQVPDAALREKLTPRYPFGCKRPSFSNTYFPTFNRDHVDLITDPITRITATGIVSGARDPETGQVTETEHPIDTLVLATGFKVMELGAMPAFPVFGAQGVELGAFWDENRYQNFEGISTPLAPNFWLMNGPWSVAGASWFSVIESGSRHIVRCLVEARERGAVRMTVRQGAHDAYMDSMRKKVQHTVFVQPCGNANSYYFDRHGDAPFVRPVSGPSLWWASKSFDLDSYEYVVDYAERGLTGVGGGGDH